MYWMIAACWILCLGVCLPMMFRYRPVNRKLSLTFKALATCCALLLAVCGAAGMGESAWFCVAGLALCVVADVLLDISFMPGMGVFLAGHICYCAWFYARVGVTKVHAIALICFLFFGACLLYTFRKDIGKKRMLPFGAYILFLSMMASSAIAYGVTAGNLPALLSLAGGFLFLVSDCMVFYKLMKPMPAWYSVVLMVLYEIAQLLIGTACFLLAV